MDTLTERALQSGQAIFFVVFILVEQQSDMVTNDQMIQDQYEKLRGKRHSFALELKAV